MFGVHVKWLPWKTKHWMNMDNYHQTGFAKKWSLNWYKTIRSAFISLGTERIWNYSFSIDFQAQPVWWQLFISIWWSIFQSADYVCWLSLITTKVKETYIFLYSPKLHLMWGHLVCMRFLKARIAFIRSSGFSFSSRLAFSKVFSSSVHT